MGGSSSSSSSSSSQSQTTKTYDLKPTDSGVAVAGEGNTVTVETLDDDLFKEAVAFGESALRTVETSVDEGYNFASQVHSDSLDFASESLESVETALKSQAGAVSELVTKIEQGEAWNGVIIALAVGAMVVIILMVTRGKK